MPLEASLRDCVGLVDSCEKINISMSAQMCAILHFHLRKIYWVNFSRFNIRFDFLDLTIFQHYTGTYHLLVQ